MPDISMCDNKTCDLRHNCVRFTATPSDHQSYGDFEPVKDADTGQYSCAYYWPQTR